MADKKEVLKASIYNKGSRTWDIAGQKCAPGKSIEVDKAVAEKYVAGYPNDLVLGDSGGNQKIHNEFRKLKAENAKLKAELEELKGKKASAKKVESKKE